MKKITAFLLSQKLLSIIIVVLLISGGAWWYVSNNNKKMARSAFAEQTATVRKGDLSMSVTGSGAIMSSSKSNIVAEVQGTITEVYLKDGDQVKSGDLILELDSFQAQLNVKQLENSIAQTLLAQQYNQKSLEGVKTLAPISGEVTDIQVNIGDDVGKNATLLTIVDKSKLKLTVPFNNNQRTKLALNQEVIVNVYDTTLEKGTSTKGYITSISKPSYKTASGTEIYNLEVVLDNTGTIKEGMIANVEVSIAGEELKSAESASLSYCNNIAVKAATGGIVEKINVSKGQPVDKSTVLIEFNNDDLMLNIETTALKLQDYNNQLEAARNELDKYYIYAPIDGVMSLNDLKDGAVLKSGDVIGYTADYNRMAFEISIDELDISKIKVGQKVNVTVDALAETEKRALEGMVTKVALEGTSSNGVTTYPVTIQIDKADNLKSGMNANAEILVEQRNAVLYVPIQAVSKRAGKSFVYVKKDEASSSENRGSSEAAADNEKRNNSKLNPYANAEMRAVEIGINNEEFIEITSGLTEGEIIILPSISSTQTGTQNMRREMGVMPVMGGGAAPAAGQSPRRQ